MITDVNSQDRLVQETFAGHLRDHVTVEDTFAKLMELANGLNAEQRRTVEEGLNDDELALFDLLGPRETRSRPPP